MREYYGEEHGDIKCKKPGNSKIEEEQTKTATEQSVVVYFKNVVLWSILLKLYPC